MRGTNGGHATERVRVRRLCPPYAAGATSAVVFIIDDLARAFEHRRLVQGHAIVAAGDDGNLFLLHSGGQYDNAIPACVKNPEVADIRRARLASDRRARGRGGNSGGRRGHPPRGIAVGHPRGRSRNRPHLNLSGGSAALRQHTCKNEKRAFHRYSFTRLRQHRPMDACINPSTISLRQAGPLQVSLFGMKRLPPNQGWFRLLLVQSMPTPFPSASLTLVNQSNRASSRLCGTSTWKPMNSLVGASRR